MSKRFFDTEMVLRPWYRSLTPRLKALWVFMLSRCDLAGVIDMDWGLASFAIGEPVSASDISAMDGNAVVLESGRLFIPGFVAFQYGELSEVSRPHISVLKTLSSHGIPYPIDVKGLPKGIETLKDKDKDKDKAKAQAKAQPAKKPRERNLHMDALSTCEGGPVGITPPTWSKIAKALADIRAASPAVTPDEILRRIANYRTHMPDCQCTATAMANHWATCATAKPAARAKNAEQASTIWIDESENRRKVNF